MDDTQQQTEVFFVISTLGQRYWKQGIQVLQQIFDPGLIRNPDWKTAATPSTWPVV